MTKLWIVRAGKQGERELAAIAESRLLPGFVEVGDLRLYPNREAIAAHLGESYGERSQNTRCNFAAQLNQFAHTIQQADIVVLPRAVTNGVAVGKGTGDLCI
jgi:restriction system protein